MNVDETIFADRRIKGRAIFIGESFFITYQPQWRFLYNHSIPPHRDSI